MIHMHVYSSHQELVEQLAHRTIALLKAQRRRNGRTTWMVSGGSTPAPLFAYLAAQDMDWTNIHMALVDERWVAEDHPRSNARFVKENFLDVCSTPPSFTGMKTEDETPDAAQMAVNARYSALPPTGPLLLGLGADGHTASLFPDAKGLEAAMNPADTQLVAPIHARKTAITGAETMRMTVTLAAIKQAMWPHLMIVGAEKRATLEAALQDDSLPITRLAAALPMPLDVFWAPKAGDA